MAKVPFADDVGSVAGRREDFCDGLLGQIQAPGNLLRRVLKGGGGGVRGYEGCFIRGWMHGPSEPLSTDLQGGVG